MCKAGKDSIPEKLVFVRNRNKKSEYIIILTTDCSLPNSEVIRIYGIHWLLLRLEICPKNYYNYRKHQKPDYHNHNGIDGYRSIPVYPGRRVYCYNCATSHKYMNRELRLHSIVRPKKPGAKLEKPHKVFENRLKQNFSADRSNRKWCTDFTIYS